MGDGVTSDNLPTVSEGPRTEVRRPDFGAWRDASSGCRPASGPHSLVALIWGEVCQPGSGERAGLACGSGVVRGAGDGRSGEGASG